MGCATRCEAKDRALTTQKEIFEQWFQCQGISFQAYGEGINMVKLGKGIREAREAAKSNAR